MHRVSYVGTPACEHCGSVACSVRQAADVRARCMHVPALANVHAAVLVATSVTAPEQDAGLDILAPPPVKRAYKRKG
jgi:hypothetical protein